MVALATSVHASPRVYALLLGAGVSMGAGIKTGWGVVEDLVRRAAVADDPGSDTAGEDAAQDPQAWWDAHATGPLGYSALLAALGTTPAARQALLSGYLWNSCAESWPKHARPRHEEAPAVRTAHAAPRAPVAAPDLLGRVPDVRGAVAGCGGPGRSAAVVSPALGPYAPRGLPVRNHHALAGVPRRERRTAARPALRLGRRTKRSGES
jgi:hypothetical protein